MHYNTFRLGREPMDEPLPRLLDAAASAGVRDRVVRLEEGKTWFVGGPQGHKEDTAANLKLA
jgi:hypothetical protein